MNQNQTIWKFEALERGIVNPKFSIEMPKKSKILSIHYDEITKIPYIYVLCFPNNIKEIRFFELFRTGSEIDNNISVEREYIGTFYFNGYVGHLFECFNDDSILKNEKPKEDKFFNYDNIKSMRITTQKILSYIFYFCILVILIHYLIKL